MKIKITFAYALIPFLLLSGCAGMEKKVSTISDGIIKESLSHDTDLRHIMALLTQFDDSAFSAAKLKTYSDRTVSRLYEALGTTVFYFHENDRYLGLQSRVLAEKIRRGKYNNHDLVDMCQSYLSERMFAEAASLHKAFSAVKLPTVPEVTVSSGAEQATRWRVYNISAKGLKAELKALPLDHGPAVIMVMQTGCHFSQEAMEQIVADKELAPVFEKYGMLLAEQFDAVGITLWQEHFNFPNIYIAERTKYFPGLAFDSFPHFYFFKDGKIIAQFEGWDSKNPDGGIGKLRKALATIIDMPPADTQPR